jgi:hypothetical protein
MNPIIAPLLHQSIFQTVRGAVKDQYGVRPMGIALIRPRSIPDDLIAAMVAKSQFGLCFHICFVFQFMQRDGCKWVKDWQIQT